MQLRPQPIERPSERRQTNDVRLPNGRFGPKMDKEALEGHQNLYQLPWSEQLAKNVAPLAIASKYEGDGGCYACTHLTNMSMLCPLLVKMETGWHQV